MWLALTLVTLAQADVKALPLLAPAYTQELGFLVSAGGSATWNGDPQRPDLPRSTLSALVGASSVGAFILQSRLVTYLEGDSTRINALLDFRDQPDHYFGVGFDNGAHRVIGRDTTFLRRAWWNVEPTLLRRIAGPLFGGVTLQLSGSAAREMSEGVATDPDFVHTGPLVINTGVGVTLQLDTRDVPVNARSGLLFAATWTGFGKALGATTEFHAFSFDYRQYVELFRPGSTLCWEVKYRAAFGDVPWSEMTKVGTPFDLRAYRWGQYRERTGMLALLEYRFMPFATPHDVIGPNGLDLLAVLTHLGLAVWGGVGVLGNTALPDFTNLLPSVGAGLRIELLKRVTVRLDVGFGRDSRSVSFNFLEAF